MHLKCCRFDAKRPPDVLSQVVAQRCDSRGTLDDLAEPFEVRAICPSGARLGEEGQDVRFLFLYQSWPPKKQIKQ